MAHFRLATHNPPRPPHCTIVPEIPASSGADLCSDWPRGPRAGGSGAMAEPELSAEALRERLRRELGAEHVEVEDTTASRCACSFRVLVVAAAFRGQGLLQRHRLVNAALGAALGRIHALEQRTLTPEQWAAEVGAGSG
ncbi:bolA-like protein 2 [Numida meleagris]|uniref:bolA-like protein 2 n=1 Tax=Numida meleagris TaxID=8996 RepID=UPI000B3D8EBA|nr:bolA-like protein 2 [Numida meleagris]